MTAALPFKWVNGLISVTGYPKWFKRQPRPYPLCSHDHPLDPLSFVAYCQSQLPDSLRHQILCTGPAEIQSQLRPLLIVQPSLDALWSLRDRRYFVWALLPSTYSHQLFSIPALNLCKAFDYHSKAISTVAPVVLKALHEAPLPCIPPPLLPTHAAFTAFSNTFSNTSTYSQLHNPPPPPATHTYTPKPQGYSQGQNQGRANRNQT